MCFIRWLSLIHILDRLLNGKPFVEKHNTNQKKTVYHGNLSDEELAEKAKLYGELYWNVGVDKFDENLAALEKIFLHCEENGIRARVLWMPWNPQICV